VKAARDYIADIQAVRRMQSEAERLKRFEEAALQEKARISELAKGNRRARRKARAIKRRKGRCRD